MKEVFVIGCHISNEIQVSYLSELIHKIKSAGKDYIIVSHTQVPNFLTKDAISYLYDSDNYIITPSDLSSPSYLFWFATEDFVIKSTTLGPGSHLNYSVAVLNLLRRGIMLAKSFNYDIVHWVEYDFDLNLEFSNLNYKILIENLEVGMVAYKKEENIYLNDFTNKTVKNHIFGSFFSLKTEKFNPFYFFSPREFLIKDLEGFYFATEVFIEEKILLEDSKIFYLDLLKYDFKNRNNVSKGFQFALHEEEGTFKIFSLNRTDMDFYFLASLDEIDTKIFMPENSWNFQTLGTGEREILIECNGKFLKIDLKNEKSYQYYIKETIIEKLK